jgi:hypothetical protein
MSGYVPKKTITFESASIAILLILGFGLRLRQYLTGRSLWADEAMLALNIVNRGFAELFQPLDFNQGAPIGFLLIEKFFNAILGRHELVLRFFPFLAGIAAFGLFYLLVRQVTFGVGKLVALALFAVNPQLIYYTSESKQYIVDVMVLLALLVLALPLFQEAPRRRDYLRLGVAGMLALWFSHPALFALAGIGIALFIHLVRRRDLTANLRWLTTLGIFWLTNFASLYFVSLRNLSNNTFLTEYWANEFFPIPMSWDWFTTYVSDTMALQFGIQFLPWLVVILILAGWFSLYYSFRPMTQIIALITIFAFVASALQLYPVKGRLALFLIPLGMIVLGKAVELAQKVFAINKVMGAVTTIALSGYLLFGPFITSVQAFVTPKYFEHIRPYMDYLSASWKEDDEIFVSVWAEPAFQYYAPFYHLEHVRYRSSAYEDYQNPQALQSRFNPLIGKKRVWVLFSHVYEQGNFNERDFIVAYLDEIGSKTREFRFPNASVYLFLYDLSQ